MALIQITYCAKKPKKQPAPVTVRTQMNVNDSDGMKFLQIKVRKDGKPVGIFYKPYQTNAQKNQKNKKRFRRNADEIIEIVGTREHDNEHDKKNIYRNAMIVNNTLVPYPPDYRPHKMERSNVAKYFHNK